MRTSSIAASTCRCCVCGASWRPTRVHLVPSKRSAALAIASACRSSSTEPTSYIAMNIPAFPPHGGRRYVALLVLLLLAGGAPAQVPATSSDLSLPADHE